MSILSESELIALFPDNTSRQILASSSRSVINTMFDHADATDNPHSVTLSSLAVDRSNWTSNLSSTNTIIGVGSIYQVLIELEGADAINFTADKGVSLELGTISDGGIILGAIADFTGGMTFANDPAEEYSGLYSMDFAIGTTAQNAGASTFDATASNVMGSFYDMCGNYFYDNTSSYWDFVLSSYGKQPLDLIALNNYVKTDTSIYLNCVCVDESITNDVLFDGNIQIFYVPYVSAIE